MVDRLVIRGLRVIPDLPPQGGELGRRDDGELPDLIQGDGAVVHELRADLAEVLFGISGPLPRRPVRHEPEQTVGDPVGDHPAVHGLGRPGRPPGDEGRGAAGVREDVPQRLDLSPAARHRNLPPGLGVLDEEVDDAVLFRGLAGGDARPQERRESRDHRLDVPPGAARLQPGEVRQLPSRHQGIDDLPVGRVEPQDGDLVPGVHQAVAQGARGDRRQGIRLSLGPAETQDDGGESPFLQGAADLLLEILSSFEERQRLGGGAAAPSGDDLGDGGLHDRLGRAGGSRGGEQPGQGGIVDLRLHLEGELDVDPLRRAHPGG